MSEYQYFDFRAIDRPLTEKEMQTLRLYSTRAEITRNKFVNEYHWGDFKGDADAWMKKYFDLFFYYANWGTRVLKFRLPKSLLSMATAGAYCRSDSAYAIKAGTNVVFNFISEENYDEFWDDDAEYLAGFMAIRTALISGDLRALYLGWLLGVQSREVPDNELEPMVPPGLNRLNASLDCFARFMDIDMDLIHVAAQTSPELQHVQPSRKEILAWVTGLSAKEKDSTLARIIADKDVVAATELQHRFLEYLQNRRKPKAHTAHKQRTVAELLAAAEHHAKERKQAEARKRAEEEKRRAHLAAQSRSKYLETLKSRQAKIWNQIDELIATKQPNRYNQAVTLLIDLRDLAQREGKHKLFDKKLTTLRENHQRKPSLMDRLGKAGL